MPRRDLIRNVIIVGVIGFGTDFCFEFLYFIHLVSMIKWPMLL